MKWYLTKIITPSGIEIIYALGDFIEPGGYDWGTIERIRELTPEETTEVHVTENKLLTEWAKTIPGYVD